jgi:hypothetical protein
VWLKTRKLNALLAPLAPTIDGQTGDGRLKGSYRDYAVEVWPHSGYPIDYSSGASYGSLPPEPVNMLRVVLSGVGGSQFWHCQSSASSYMQDLTSRFTAGPLLNRFKPGEFRFEGVDRLHDSVERMGESLVKRLGMPFRASADPALQERLIAAGLFDELDALRFGSHPYLPKVEFLAGGRAMTELYMSSPAFTRGQPAVEERLRAAGLPDYRSLMEAKMNEIENENPGRLEFNVEAGERKVLSADQFRELLERAVRIARINAEVNQKPELS